MKSSHAAALVALFSVVVALPQADVVKRADPDDVPVTFDQMTTTDYTCGKHTAYVCAPFMLPDTDKTD